LYTGITTEPERRFRQHAAGLGAKFFRARQPLEIVYLERGHTHGTACRREIEIKGMTKKNKSALIYSKTDQTTHSGVLIGE
jgi:putative endonuclease